MSAATTTVARHSSRSSGLPQHQAERRLGRRLLLPTAILLTLMVGYPIVWALRLSLFSDSITGQTHLVGFDNYARALWGSDAVQFWAAVRDTALFTVAAGGLELVIGVAMALVMSHLGVFRGLVRAMILVPWAIPTAVAAVLWKWMLTPNGIVNELLGRQILWTGETTPARTAVVLIDVWKTAPFVGLLVLAGLQLIPKDLYESAKIDGAGAVRRFRSITLPLVAPAILVAMLFRVLDLMRMYDTPAILTNGANGTATLSLFTYEHAIDQAKFGYGSALSTLTFMLIFAAAFLIIRLCGVKVFASDREGSGG
ncbi:carbohydrate ABC transporter permease [Jiangella asiatica]|uniref:Sugar ABC transporter permease n=1 Tax=Jiangella asiatica TaxID=2530372 RepID=A0A4R5DCJ8_9ACTN|nr:sugar ABC transporter permease [Jiangella asiatica]TDE11429.1 sugar ABC transporter permease [Jiangella asiatica]